jgi:hypothetical protein
MKTLDDAPAGRRAGITPGNLKGPGSGPCFEAGLPSFRSAEKGELMKLSAKTHANFASLTNL